MTIERAVTAFAGTIVLISLFLGYVVSLHWHLLTAFAGFNLLQSSFTGFCPAAIAFRRLGLTSSSATP